MDSNTKDLAAISLLLVEDDKPSLDCLILVIRKKYPVVTIHSACDGKMGLELFREYLPEIVITDFNMPEMHGMEMAREIRAIKPETKFIILTGNSDIQSKQNSDEKGFTFDHYIVKPVLFQDLFSALEQCLGEMV
jgi:YesN/AraC family two-component response regulator